MYAGNLFHEEAFIYEVPSHVVGIVNSPGPILPLHLILCDPAAFPDPSGLGKVTGAIDICVLRVILCHHLPGTIRCGCHVRLLALKAKEKSRGLHRQPQMEAANLSFLAFLSFATQVLNLGAVCHL